MASTKSTTLCRLCALLLLATNLQRASCTEPKSILELEMKVLDSLLHPSRYDPRLRPAGRNDTERETTRVDVQVFVRSIRGIDDRNMEYDVELVFRLHWVDERLGFNDYRGMLKYLTLTDVGRVWMPDIFFRNEMYSHFHNMIMPNVYIRIFPYASIFYSARITMRLSCPMNLKLYPHDRQVCNIRMASYGWTTDDLVLRWKVTDPVDVVKYLQLPGYTLEKFVSEQYNSTTNTGEYSCLEVDLLFKRELSFYLLCIYAPTFMLVVASWVSFWFDPEAITARMCLAATTILAIIVLTWRIKLWLPAVNYIMAVDVWLGVSVTFVFGALLQLALVSYLCRHNSQCDTTEQQSSRMEPERSNQLEETNHVLIQDHGAALAMKQLEDQSSGATTGMNQAALGRTHPLRQLHRSRLRKFHTTSQRIDLISRIAFPLAFSLFCLVYWCTYASN